MPIHDDTTITTGYGWIAVDGSCLPCSKASDAMPTLMKNATWLRRLYNTVISRGTETYYRFLLNAYDRGYILVGSDKRYLAVEACSPVVLDNRLETIDQICRDSGINKDTLIPRRYVYSVVDDVYDPVTRRKYFSENLKPPLVVDGGSNK